MGLLAAVVASGTIARMLPAALPLPVSLVQIALGALIGSFGALRVELDPEVFFLAFLPPLLFADSWQIPREGLLRDKWTILKLALGLVVFTVLGLGPLIHWMLPVMPLAVCFALAASVSPTDPVSVQAIAGRIKVPTRMLRILEGEALLNDASGLVCMRVAVIAALTGGFSLSSALSLFLWLSLVGIALGIGVTLLITRVAAWIRRHFGEESGSHILISVLTPFAVYLLAEHFGGSGILAVVAAGITMSYAELMGDQGAGTRIRSLAVWDAIRFATNGVMFVLLGEQMPGIFTAALSQSRDHIGWPLPLVALIIVLALAALRFTWVWSSLRITVFRSRRRGVPAPQPPVFLLLAASVAGVRGAVTLAGILTLPLTLPDGSPFPARELAIFLAAAVILLTLVAASFLLPPLIRHLHLPEENELAAQEAAMRVQAAEAAIQAIGKEQHAMAEGRQDTDLYAEVSARLMDLYRRRLEGTAASETDAATNRRLVEIERELRLAAVRAERETILRAARRRRINDEVRRKLIRELDIQEVRFLSMAGR
ncbi:sodium/proton antiporter, CPA1 family [Arboricoccus pini]|uniref:Sodium/proton antiporter, CPA1 family n=1 Tax=Arboricoccus pini TaxID=1963835 RepID=A0A212PX32_9PROT|nr:Na+/H+ antiporter [Arboricoccus pini]SNB51617.1 sodium/proton antiporter, CPA1 family [Arboricoccus pini]